MEVRSQLLARVAAGALVASPALAGPSAQDVSDAVADVAGRAIPAVVHIRVQRGDDLAPALRELAHEVPGLVPPDGAPSRGVSGSGVIVSEDGRVLTNHHVVDGAREITVVLSDQRYLPASVVGSDPRTDIAVLQIDAEGPWPWLSLGDSDALRVGELVLAIGSPFDFASTVTLGVVSALGRHGLSEREIQDFVQTDAAVNPGNSGGPLVDLNGRVVALNTAIFSPGVEQNSGVSFAIPAAMLLRVSADLVDLGRARRPWLGVVVETVEDVEGDLTRRGAEVAHVIAESPAARAGLRRGDVVVAADGRAVSSAADLRGYVLSRGVGSEVVLRVVRDGTPVDVTVGTVEQRAERVAIDLETDEVWGWGGTLLAEPREDVLSRYGVPIERGVVVADVEPDTEAARFGVLPGDVVVEVQGRQVSGLAELREALVAVGGRYVVVTFRRDDGEVVGILPRE